MRAREAEELQVLSADYELRAKVKAWVSLGDLPAGSVLVCWGWAPECRGPLLPGEPLTEPSTGTQDPEWGKRWEF